MQLIILAGGKGTRIAEESHLKPKPMIEIGGVPIICHLMAFYYRQGIHDFIICGGYKFDYIKQYFLPFITDRKGDAVFVDMGPMGKWKLTILDTGFETMTGGRIRRIAKYIAGDRFMITYGDGLSDVDLNEVLLVNDLNDSILTITAVQPESRYGVVEFDGETAAVKSFREKSKEDAGWINGGFMVARKELFDYLESDETILEKKPMEILAMEGKMSAYRHHGFWQCMDTMRDKEKLESIYASGEAPWMK